jgi:hypothetical protein
MRTDHQQAPQVARRLAASVPTSGCHEVAKAGRRGTTTWPNWDAMMTMAASASLNEQQRTGKLFLGYLRAYSRAIRWLYDPKNKDQAINLLVKYSKQDRKDSADTYDYFVTKLRAFSADGRISDTSYQENDRRTRRMGGSQATSADVQVFRLELH